MIESENNRKGKLLAKKEHFLALFIEHTFTFSFFGDFV